MHRRILLFLQGYVRVRLSGFEPERFVNLCQGRGMELWNLVMETGNGRESGIAAGTPKKAEPALTCCMRVEDFRQLGELVTKTRTRVRIVEKQGLPFILYRNRRRKGWAVGLLTAFFLLYASAGRLWQVEFEGNRQYTTPLLTKCLREAGYDLGMSMKDIVCEDIEKMLRIEYNDITWVSAEISGTCLTIRIEENEEPARAVGQEVPCDLVATQDAVIQEIVTRAGTPLVKAGDQVQAGDVLVRGNVDILDDSKTVVGSHAVAADADIVGMYSFTYTDEFPINAQRKTLTGQEVRVWEFWGWGQELRFGRGPEGWHCETVELLERLPFGVRVRTYREFAAYEARRTESEARAFAEARLKAFLADFPADTLEWQGLALEQNAGMWYVTATVSAVGPIDEKMTISDTNDFTNRTGTGIILR